MNGTISKSGKQVNIWKMCNARNSEPGTVVWDLYKNGEFERTGDYTVLFDFVRAQRGDIYIEEWNDGRSFTSYL